MTKQALKRYDSVQEFYNDLKNSEKLGDMSDSGSVDFAFTGTRNIEEANKLLLYGDTQTVDLIASETTKQKRNESRARIYTSYAGFVPNVPGYLSGRPDNMFNIKSQKITTSSKVINIIYFIGAFGDTDKEELANAGARLLRVVKTAEKNGYRCNLYAGRVVKIMTQTGTFHEASFAVKIKDSGKPLNISNIAYPLANPSFFRRHAFWWNDCQTTAVNAQTVTDKKLLEATAKEINKNATWIDFYTLSETSDSDTYKRLITNGK